MRTALIYTAGLLALVTNACAADVTGTWMMIMRTPEGSKHESTLNLQSDGSKVTGKLVSGRGTAELSNGVVNGSDISFTIVRAGNGDELKIDFQGTVDGDTIKLRMQYRDHDPIDLTGRRGVTNDNK